MGQMNVSYVAICQIRVEPTVNYGLGIRQLSLMTVGAYTISVQLNKSRFSEVAQAQKVYEHRIIFKKFTFLPSKFSK